MPPLLPGRRQGPEIPRPRGSSTHTPAQAVFRLAIAMKAKLSIATVSLLVVGLVVAGAASGAFVAIYRNALETTAQRSEMLKLSGKVCTRGGGRRRSTSPSAS